MVDVTVSALLLSVAVVVAGSYWARVMLHGAPHFERIERNGTSPLLGHSAMEMAYWAIAPLGESLARWGVTANAVTAASLIFGVAAAVGLGVGHFGVAAGFSAISALADALDGYVARATGTASDSGETYDAAVDRYVEFFFFGGLLFHHRSSAFWIALVFVALVGSFMVSYGTAKAEALHVDPPRGAMRRSERAAYLTFGALLTPLSTALLPSAFAEAPLVIALGLVGVVANVSAVHRLFRIAALASRRSAVPSSSAPPSSDRPRAAGQPIHGSAGSATT